VRVELAARQQAVQQEEPQAYLQPGGRPLELVQPLRGRQASELKSQLELGREERQALPQRERALEALQASLKRLLRQHLSLLYRPWLLLPRQPLLVPALESRREL
jgi:hypothetical protein